MTLADRAESYRAAFPKFPASWPWLTYEQGRRKVLYGIWLIGNNYKNKTPFYGAYPPGLLDRILALFPDVNQDSLLHVFSGSLPAGPYTRLDSNPELKPDVVGSVYDAPALLRRRAPFDLVMADPPYTAADAARYGCAGLNRRRALAALAGVTASGRHLTWLDQTWPMHSKSEWRTVGRILVQRSTNHRVRALTIFERTAA